MFPGSGLKRDNRGASAVEFALVAPLVFGVLLALIGLSLFLYKSHTLNSVMRDSIRQVLVLDLKEEAAIRTHIVESLEQTGFADATSQVRLVTISDEEAVANIRVTYSFAPGMPFGAGALFDHVYVADIPIFTGFL